MNISEVMTQASEELLFDAMDRCDKVTESVVNEAITHLLILHQLLLDGEDNTVVGLVSPLMSNACDAAIGLARDATAVCIGIIVKKLYICGEINNPISPWQIENITTDAVLEAAFLLQDYEFDVSDGIPVEVFDDNTESYPNARY